MLALRASNGQPFQYYRPSSGEQPTALLVLCHPSDGPSLCRSLAEIWEESLKEVGVKVQRLDLRGADHMGLASPEELKASLIGKDSPADVQRMQALVDESRFLIFVHPIFWFDVPSQLKGFQESVLSSGFAFRKLPGHWLLNRAAGIVERLPVAPRLMRRYAAYGMLRDKHVFVTRTQGGPSAGMGIFGHEATSLESSLQFCGAHLDSVDRIGEIDDTSQKDLAGRVLPDAKIQIVKHCQRIGKIAAWASHQPALTVAATQAKLTLKDASTTPTTSVLGCEEVDT